LSSRRLFNGSRSSSLFEVVLSGAEMCEAALPQLLGTPSVATPLPPILNVQMDIVAGDNKIGLCSIPGPCLLQRAYSKRFM
jgi:hypothetical protein